MAIFGNFKCSSSRITSNVPGLYFSEHYQLYVPESAQSGSAVGKIKANDADTGSNADMKYTILSGDGAGVFSILANKETKEGIISLKKVSRIFTKRFLCEKNLKDFESL